MDPTPLWPWGRDRLLAAVVCAALFASALPNLVAHPFHPLFGPGNVLVTDPTSEVFREDRTRQAPMLAAAERVRILGCRRVAFVTGDGGYEYALWRLLNGPLHLRDPVRLEHLYVANGSRHTAVARPPFEPCAQVWSSEADIEVRSPSGGALER